MIFHSTIDALVTRIATAHETYGPIASTHEALGVASEEWDELRAAIHANNRLAIAHEALDLAAILIRLHDAMDSIKLRQRSGLK